MVGKSKVDVVAGKLRWAIIQGQFTDEWMPSEETMAKELKVSRPTLRSALMFLRSERLVESVPGVRWRAIRRFDDTSFETLTRLFEDMDAEQRPEVIQALLDHRADLVVGVVSSLLHQKETVADAPKAAAHGLVPSTVEPTELTTLVLDREDAFFTALVDNHGNLSKRLAAQQVQRALKVARAWLNPLCRITPNGTRFSELIVAIDAHEPWASDLAHQAVTARDTLYNDLIQQRAKRFPNGNTTAEAQVG